jgi:DNA ligase-1
MIKILYQKTKLGKINLWKAWNEGNKIFTSFGQIDGKIQTTCGTECVATNIGKSNERNPIQQAEFEIDAMYKKQLRLKYFVSIIEAENNKKIIPMLALDGHKVKFPFPVDVQRKFDGFRNMKLEDGTLLSRGNKVFDVQHIKEELKQIPFPMTDGELYIHGLPLQRISSLVTRPREESLRLEYHIYDVPCDKPWKERKEMLKLIKPTEHIKVVETFVANNIEELVKLHDQFIEEGYEGAIIRLEDGEYEYGKRSKSLLKWKNFEDKEFKIVGIEVGTGKYSECPIFVCRNDINDKVFNVVPIGTMEAKKEMLDNSNIGKLLTVKFLGRSEDGIPKIAVGKIIRSEEDMPQQKEE